MAEGLTNQYGTGRTWGNVTIKRKVPTPSSGSGGGSGGSSSSSTAKSPEPSSKPNIIVINDNSGQQAALIEQTGNKIIVTRYSGGKPSNKYEYSGTPEQLQTAIQQERTELQTTDVQARQQQQANIISQQKPTFSSSSLFSVEAQGNQKSSILEQEGKIIGYESDAEKRSVYVRPSETITRQEIEQADRTRVTDAQQPRDNRKFTSTTIESSRTSFVSDPTQVPQSILRNNISVGYEDPLTQQSVSTNLSKSEVREIGRGRQIEQAREKQEQKLIFKRLELSRERGNLTVPDTFINPTKQFETESSAKEVARLSKIPTYKDKQKEYVYNLLTSIKAPNIIRKDSLKSKTGTPEGKRILNKLKSDIDSGNLPFIDMTSDNKYPKSKQDYDSYITRLQKTAYTFTSLGKVAGKNVIGGFKRNPIQTTLMVGGVAAATIFAAPVVSAVTGVGVATATTAIDLSLLGGYLGYKEISEPGSVTTLPGAIITASEFGLYGVATKGVGAAYKSTKVFSDKYIPFTRTTQAKMPTKGTIESVPLFEGTTRIVSSKTQIRNTGTDVFYSTTATTPSTFFKDTLGAGKFTIDIPFSGSKLVRSLKANVGKAKFTVREPAKGSVGGDRAKFGEDFFYLSKSEAYTMFGEQGVGRLGQTSRVTNDNPFKYVTRTIKESPRRLSELFGRDYEATILRFPNEKVTPFSEGATAKIKSGKTGSSLRKSLVSEVKKGTFEINYPSVEKQFTINDATSFKTITTKSGTSSVLKYKSVETIKSEGAKRLHDIKIEGNKLRSRNKAIEDVLDIISKHSKETIKNPNKLKQTQESLLNKFDIDSFKSIDYYQTNIKSLNKRFDNAITNKQKISTTTSKSKVINKGSTEIGFKSLSPKQIKDLPFKVNPTQTEYTSIRPGTRTSSLGAGEREFVVKTSSDLFLLSGGKQRFTYDPAGKQFLKVIDVGTTPGPAPKQPINILGRVKNVRDIFTSDVLGLKSFTPYKDIKPSKPVRTKPININLASNFVLGRSRPTTTSARVRNVRQNIDIVPRVTRTTRTRTTPTRVTVRERETKRPTRSRDLLRELTRVRDRDTRVRVTDVRPRTRDRKTRERIDPIRVREREPRVRSDRNRIRLVETRTRVRDRRIQITPRKIKPPVIGFGFKGGKADKKKKKAITIFEGKYRPSLYAADFNIKGKRPDYLTGYEVRPL